MCRKDLIEEGVPILASPGKQKARICDKRAWMFYADVRRAVHKHEVGKLRKSDANRKLSQFAKEFQDLPVQEKLPYEALAKQHVRDFKSRTDPEDKKLVTDTDEQYCRHIGDRLWGISTRRQPISEKLVDETAVKLGSNLGDGSRKGLTQYKVSFVFHLVRVASCISLVASFHHCRTTFPPSVYRTSVCVGH